tara:strand:- start:124 stop:456 length:333 start_codon:yes stop_codon:yes gene_type:complete
MNASTGRFKLPDRNVLAGGLVAVLAWLLNLGLGYAGLPSLDADILIPLLLSLWGTFSYLVPPSIADFLARLDGIAKQAATSASSAGQEAEVRAAASSLAHNVSTIKARES